MASCLLLSNYESSEPRVWLYFHTLIYLESPPIFFTGLIKPHLQLEFHISLCSFYLYLSSTNGGLYVFRSFLLFLCSFSFFILSFLAPSFFTSFHPTFLISSFLPSLLYFPCLPFFILLALLPSFIPTFLFLSSFLLSCCSLHLSRHYLFTLLSFNLSFLSFFPHAFVFPFHSFSFIISLISSLLLFIIHSFYFCISSILDLFLFHNLSQVSFLFLFHFYFWLLLSSFIPSFPPFFPSFLFSSSIHALLCSFCSFIHL